jgi:hypothetical protein
MNDDNKKLFWIVLATAALAGMWWFGWFKPVTDTYLNIKSNITYP